MKLYLLIIFAIMAGLVLLAIPQPAKAQEEEENASDVPPQLPEPPSPGPGPFRPGPLRPFPFLRPFRANPFNIFGNFTDRPFRPFLFPFAVYFDDNAVARVQDENVKVPFVREPRGDFF